MNKIEETIKDLGFEIDKIIRKNYQNESNYSKKSGKNKQTLNGILNRMKTGKSVVLRSVIEILDFSGYELIIVKKKVD